MTKLNDIFQAGELVCHKIFGVGVVTDYLFAEDPEREHNKVGVHFDDYGHKWLIAAPGYLQKEQVPAEQVNQDTGAGKRPDQYQATFVREGGDDEKHHLGAHWRPFCDDPMDVISDLPQIIGDAKLPVAFGDSIKKLQIPNSWVQGFHLCWPKLNQGLMLSLAVLPEGNQLISLYPFYTGGVQIRGILDHVSVWQSGVEAQVTVVVGNTRLTFFDALFLSNRHLYRSGNSLEFVLTGMAYSAEPAQQQEITLPSDAKSNKWLSILSGEYGDACGVSDHILSLVGAAFFFPVTEMDEDDYQFRGPVKEVQVVDEILGQSGWLVTVTVLRHVEEEIEDFDLKILITKRAWSGLRQPEVGQDIQGTLWLQGYLWGNYLGGFIDE